MNKSIKNGYYKLKTKDGDKWLHFSRLFISKLEEVSGKNIVEYGEYLKRIRRKSLDLTEQFDAITDLVHSAGIIANDEKEGNDIDYDSYKGWRVVLYYATEE